jgi:hypothetical protein
MACYRDIFASLFVVIIIIIPLSRALLEKPPVVQILKNFPTFYGP